MAWIARFILAVRLLGYVRMCQLVLKDQITWLNPVSPMSHCVIADVEARRRGGRGVMVVLAIVLVTFFGAGVVFGLNWIYSRSVRRVPIRRPRRTTDLTDPAAAPRPLLGRPANSGDQGEPRLPVLWA